MHGACHSQIHGTYTSEKLDRIRKWEWLTCSLNQTVDGFDFVINRHVTCYMSQNRGF